MRARNSTWPEEARARTRPGCQPACHRDPEGVEPRLLVHRPDAANSRSALTGVRHDEDRRDALQRDRHRLRLELWRLRPGVAGLGGDLEAPCRDPEVPEPG